MSLWSRVTGPFRKRSGDPAQNERLWDGAGGGYATATGLTISQLSAMQATAVMACTSILSEDLAKLPWHVMRPTGRGGKVIAEDHWLESLLQEPNDWQTGFEFKEQMQGALLLRGNAYAVTPRDGRGRATSLIPLNPDRVTLWEAPDGSLFYWANRSGLHEMAVLRSEPLLIPADDMFHLRWQTQNGLTGLSRIGLQREAIALSIAQERMSSSIAGNGARPGGVLQTDKKLSDATFDRLTAKWQENRSGLPNAGKTVILEEGLKWQAMGMTMADAEFLAQRRFQVEEIARIYRIPAHKLGIMEKSIGQSMASLDQDYVNNVLTSYMKRWEEKIEKHFRLNRDGVSLEFDTSHFLRADITARYAAYRTAIVGMFMQPNQARRAEGWDDCDFGDLLYQPTNVAPIGTPPSGTAGPGSDVTGAPAAGGDGDPAAVSPVPGA